MSAALADLVMTAAVCAVPAQYWTYIGVAMTAEDVVYCVYLRHSIGADDVWVLAGITLCAHRLSTQFELTAL